MGELSPLDEELPPLDEELSRVEVVELEEEVSVVSVAFLGAMSLTSFFGLHYTNRVYFHGKKNRPVRVSCRFATMYTRVYG